MKESTGKNLALLGLGVLIGVILSMSVILYDRQDTFSVGDCVRELGHSTIERITFISNKSIETEYKSYGQTHLEVYSKIYKELIKVKCEK